jgi:hypothetical protein
LGVGRFFEDKKIEAKKEQKEKHNGGDEYRLV